MLKNVRMKVLVIYLCSRDHFQEILDRRRALFKEFSEIRARLDAAYEDYQEGRIELRGRIYLLSDCLVTVG